MSSLPYSLANPPQAPKKKGPSLAERRGRLDLIPKLIFPNDNDEKKLWERLAATGFVRSKYLRWTPEDVAEMDDLDSLEHLQALYTPFSQPRNYVESAYLEIILEAIRERIHTL